MKKLLLISGLLLSVSMHSQFVVFWTEDFFFGCNSGQLADGFFSINTGMWSVSVLGPEANTPNTWFVSAEENGNLEGECGSGCGDDQTLHVGAFQTIVGTDLGASYFEGVEGFCDVFGCATTDKRAESPVINCSGMGNIVLDFLYIEGGNNLDNATLWYFDGSTWEQLADMPKTSLDCAPQGTWTSFSIPLPASANNNTNVQLGFRWQNNDDGVASDPSFAVDDINLSGDFAVDLEPPTVICPPEYTLFSGEFCGQVPDLINEVLIFDDLDPFPTVTQDPAIGTLLSPGVYPVIFTATDVAGNSSSCVFDLIVVDDVPPSIDCPSNITVQVPSGITSTFVNVPLPEITENCGGYILTNSNGPGDNASGIYPLGTTDVTFTVMDDEGNTNVCTMTVTVNEMPEDCCLGDFNCDGYISVADLIIIVPEFGCLSGCFTDLDGNGIITVADMQIFNSLYGTICP
jgi:hypothetical protein